MRERRASRRLASVTALAAGLWLAGCATTEAEGEGEAQPDIITGIATITGQIIGGVLMGVAGALGGQPQDAYGYRSPTYSTSAYRQTYAYPVYQPARPRHSHHHHHHKHGHRRR